MSTLFLFLLLVKHSICDLALQSRFVNKQGDKKNLTDLKGYLHAGDHAIGTFVVALLFAGLIPALGMLLQISYCTSLLILQNADTHLQKISNKATASFGLYKALTR